MKLNKCHECDWILSAMATKCPKCGAEVSKGRSKRNLDFQYTEKNFKPLIQQGNNTSYCDNCGDRLKEGKKFCTTCGYKLNIIPIYSSINADKQTYTPQSELDYLKCIVCECSTSYENPIRAFTQEECTISTIFQEKNTYKATTKSIKVPVCANCLKGLSNWRSKHSIERSTLYDKILGYLIIPILVPLFFTLLFRTPFFPFLLLVALIEVIYFVCTLISKHNKKNPSRYVKFRGSNTYVRPQGKGKWILYNEWLIYGQL